MIVDLPVRIPNIYGLTCDYFQYLSIFTCENFQCY